MSSEKKAAVRRYLEDVLDGGQVDLLDELFTEDCVIHRPEFPEPIVGLENFKAFMSVALTTIICRLETTVHDMFVEGDLLACRLTHKAVFCENAIYPSRVGTYEAGGRRVVWNALAMCRLREGKVAEEWVFKDEIGLLVQLGAFSA